METHAGRCGGKGAAPAGTIDSDPKERFVYHNAGLDGYGSSSYIDAVILRDRDADNTGGWAGSPDGTLEERTYYVQNWRADVVALFTDAGQLIQQIRYDGLTPAAARRGGVPFGISKTDLDANGLVSLLDYTRWLTLYDNGNGTHPYADWNWDGTVDSSDEYAFLADRSNDTSLGRGVLGYGFDHVGGSSRKGYAGYETAAELEGVKPGTYHVRHRVYLAELGRWMRRDPKGYANGANLYCYVQSGCLMRTDPSGRDFQEKLCCLWNCGVPKCRRGKRLADEALREAKRRFPDSLHNGEGDAFRHCYWSCRMKCEWGPTDQCAKYIGNCHEKDGRRRGQPPQEETMDLHNNKVGRDLGGFCMAELDCASCCASACEEAVEDGRLRIDPDDPNPARVPFYPDNTYLGVTPPPSGDGGASVN